MNVLRQIVVTLASGVCCIVLQALVIGGTVLAAGLLWRLLKGL